MSDYIHQRLEHRIQEAVSTMIVTREIKHHALSPFVSVKEVSLSKDNAYATLWVSTFEDEETLQRSVAALQSAAGFIQKRLAVLLKTRHTPKLRFKADTSLKEAQAMHELIDSLSKTDE